MRNILFINEPSHNWDLTEYYNFWEEFSNDSTTNIKMYRMSVPGGFLVVSRDTLNHTSSVNFVSEPTQDWFI